MSIISDMVARLIAAGTPPELAAVVVAEAFAAGITCNSGPSRATDETAERRRAKDRDRKRLTRDQLLPVSEWLELVGKVLTRDHHQCQYCGAGNDLTVDHVVPASRGGTHDTKNLVACCLSCNRKKSNKLLVEWLPDPQKSAGQDFVSEAARAAIVRETSAEVRRHPPTGVSPLSSSSSSSFLDTELPKKEDKKVRARAAQLSAEWQPSEAHFEAAVRLKISHSAVLEKAEDMRLWAKSKGATKVDWDATFHGFLRRDAAAGKINGHKRTVHDAAADLVERVRAFDKPCPSDLRERTGETHVRLLSKG